MKKLLSKLPILLMLTLIFVGLSSSNDTVIPFGGGIPWIIDK
ncbi:hypothetical protein [Paenibacillus agilis]|nr:hypothetical protein [Paenibacillus agilis]